ncbi:MAG: polysaccharide deacetylase family protein [Actinomycetota bacterium]|nr:polysaccharide deacetylase family protein [Actinomycetota bacterium]
MPAPDSHIARRERRRAQLRRRRLTAAAALPLVVLLAVVAFQATSGGVATRRTGERPSGRGGSQRTGGVARAAATPGSRNRAESRAVRRLAQFGLPVYCAGPRGDAVAFTFDDGPGPYTHYALEKLSQAHERATFFAVGRSIDNFPGYLVRELRVAVIGDHTYTHPLLTGLPPATAESEIARTARKIEAQTGQPVELFRPPYGARNTGIDAIVRRLGLLEIIWNVDSADSLGADYAGITRNVEAGLHPGSIILMHENRGQTIRALTTLLPELRRRHLRSVSLPQLLSADPPSLAQLKAGPGGCGGSALHGGGG